MSRRSMNRKAARHAARWVDLEEQMRLVRRAVGIPLRTQGQIDGALETLEARKQARLARRQAEADRLLVRMRAEVSRTARQIVRTMVDDGRPRTAAILAAARAYAA